MPTMFADWMVETDSIALVSRDPMAIQNKPKKFLTSPVDNPRTMNKLSRSILGYSNIAECYTSIHSLCIILALISLGVMHDT